MPRGLLQPHSSARFFLILTVVFGLSVMGMATQELEKPEATTAEQCSQYTRPSIHTSEAAQVVKLDTLLENKEQYYGKTVTVEGEMHRIFTDHVFTIEDDDFLRDDDVLIISNVPRAQAVVALGDSIDPGTDVRVTGLVHKYDRAELECLYGPLNVESREGHSFTKGPVLIVEKVSEVALEKPATAAPEPITEPLPGELEARDVPEESVTLEPAPAVEEDDIEQEQALPATASGIPLIGLLGLFSLASAYGVRYLRR